MKNCSNGLDEVLLGKVTFLGETLGPLFLDDPAKDGALLVNMLEAFASLDIEKATAEWPFGVPDDVRVALRLIHDGAAQGVDDDLIWEYRRLFVGPAKKAAPPWGSVYTDRECVIFGASTLKLRIWMRSNGIERMGSEGDPEDHIGLMLLLMAWIAEHQPESLGVYLGDHLLPWAGHFLEIVERETTHSFYRGLAILTRTSLQGVCDTLDLQVVIPRFYR